MRKKMKYIYYFLWGLFTLVVSRFFFFFFCFFLGKCNEDHVIFSSLFNGDWWMM